MRQNRIKLAFLSVLLASAWLISLAGITPRPASAAEVTRTPPVLSASGEGEILTGIWPRSMAFDTMGNLWIANGFEGTVVRLSEATGKQVEPAIEVGKQPVAMAWLDATKTMWVASYEDATLIPVELDSTGKPIKREPIPLGDSRPVGLVVSSGNLWVIAQVKDSLISKDNLIKFNPATKQILTRLTVGTFPTAIISSATDTIADDRLLFIANGHDDSISVVDTRLESGNGKITATYTDGVPPFPFSLVFDGVSLWIGSYECTKFDNDKCIESRVGRINTKTGKSIPVQEVLPGRQVFVSFNDGHVWAANGHGEGIADVNAVTTQIRRQIVAPSSGGRGAYYGAVLMSKTFVYVADWTNDRVIRFKAPGPIQIPPTPTNSPPSVTPPPSPTQPPCNPDPKFGPQFVAGDKARVIDDKFTKPLNIRKEPNFLSASLTGKLFKLGEEFMIVAGPFGNNKPLDPKTNADAACFYQIVGVKDKEFAGFVTEGGLGSDGKDKRYFIEKAK